MNRLFKDAPGLMNILILATLPWISQSSIAQHIAAPNKSAENRVEYFKKEMPAHADFVDASTTVPSIDEVAQRLRVQLPGIEFSEVLYSAIPGLYEVATGGKIYYVDETASHLIDGDVIRLSDRVNLTDARMGAVQMGLINEMDEKDMLIFEPPYESNRSITVFTDVSCGFCRRLHAEIDTLLSQGVRVRYVLFPRSGLWSQGHKDLESVWCADNPQEAMTIAKAGGYVPPSTCDNPIEAHVELASRLELRGTPLIYTDAGEAIPGYRQANELVSMIRRTQPVVGPSLTKE